ncbi:Protein BRASSINAZOLE-RESISTANT 2 [Camellia lanceoleosa]|uniref:Protein BRASSINAZOLE-RESISTANT 2 n=1 Tax=Camellia lanceoleosa TaxID=1840588 RepID=A0ACC0GYN5_9ERIC|nr:Protein BRASSINAZOLE-RESISTANT 2 [Camellia lanceoleosa]
MGGNEVEGADFYQDPSFRYPYPLPWDDNNPSSGDITGGKGEGGNIRIFRALSIRRRKRALASKIYSGLRAQGNYNLPKHCDSRTRWQLQPTRWHCDNNENLPCGAPQSSHSQLRTPIRALWHHPSTTAITTASLLPMLGKEPFINIPEDTIREALKVVLGIIST